MPVSGNPVTQQTQLQPSWTLSPSRKPFTFTHCPLVLCQLNSLNPTPHDICSFLFFIFFKKIFLSLIRQLLAQNSLYLIMYLANKADSDPDVFGDAGRSTEKSFVYNQNENKIRQKSLSFIYLGEIVYHTFVNSDYFFHVRMTLTICNIFP